MTTINALTLPSQFRLSKIAMLVFSAASCLSLSSAWASPGNPLATTDQQNLDATAIRVLGKSQQFLSGGLTFDALIATNKAAYLAGSLGALIGDAQASAALAPTINELVFSAIQKAVNSDPAHPKVYWDSDAKAKQWFGLNVPAGRYSYDNPDAIYRLIPIGGQYTYAISAHRTGNGPTDQTFSLISDPNSQTTIAYLSKNNIVVDANGNYTITISSAAPASGQTNYIQSTSAAKFLLVRDNLGNWNTETPDVLSVQRTDSLTTPAAITDAQIIATAAVNLTEDAATYGAGTLGVKTYINPVNTFSSPTQSSTLGTLVTQASSFAHVNIPTGQALVFTVQTGGAGYFVVPVSNPWTITVDPVGHQSSLNNKQAVANADGSYTFVIANQDPGVANWIDPAGFVNNTLMVRWQNLSASGVPAITNVQFVTLPAASVPLTAVPPGLQEVLPAGSASDFFSSTQRAAQLAARAAGYARRLSTQ
ncbi:DUF1214 domain-containing protein [Glaciimonas soli]|uniref:DUF1214 domain-containing protein n=1 Tax=Glaciimonas soli TaxID=2590999 RepID=A0A843YVA0_9BURK|nr:DUF1214 domain-containing protein [Glaciimonas soli]MQR01613.1 DUF1214 domain-containing protein [Glaciimonas soli]